MSIGAIARRTKNQPVTLRRASSVLYGPETVSAGETVMAGSDNRSFYVELRFADLVSDTGRFVVNGVNQAGSSVQVTFDIYGPGRYLSTRSSEKLTRVDNYTQTGLSGGTVTIQSANGSGQPIDLDINLGTFMGYLDRSRESEQLQASGNVPIKSGVIYTDPGVSVDDNDILEVDGDLWEVKAVAEYKDRNGKRGYKQIIVFAPGQN